MSDRNRENMPNCRVLCFLRRLLLSFFTINSTGFVVTAALFFLAEIVISLQIVLRVPYTEIDWSTYMQQVECYMKGERNYTRIKGSTGPIVYPAGHLAIYKFLYLWTNYGRNIRRAQYFFVGFYLVTVLLVFRMFYKSRRIPPYVLALICFTSYRIHSIFMLRLFNDPIAMLLLFVAFNLWISQYWMLGSVFYSLAVSVKMNILLYAPAVFFVFLLSTRFQSTFWLLFTCAIIQVGVASDFLLYNWAAYVSRAFEFSRVFLFKWTVNWRFLPESLFLDKRFHVALLGAHVALLVFFMLSMWFRSQGGLISLLKRLSYGIRTRLETHEVLFALFTSNLAGVVFARSLHYQFYSWYYHSLAYLLFAPMYPTTGPNDEEKIWNLLPLQSIPLASISLRVTILLCVEYCWNVYPSTVLSSVLLHICHVAIIFLLVWNRQRLPMDKKLETGARQRLLSEKKTH